MQERLWPPAAQALIRSAANGHRKSEPMILPQRAALMNARPEMLRPKGNYSNRWSWVIIIAICLLAGCQEASEVCDGLAWPMLVGKWEAAVAPGFPRTAVGEELVLFLYPDGDAIKNGQKGTWRVVTCDGPTVVLDLPHRMQTDSCELRVEGVVEADPPSVHLTEIDRIRGDLTCGSKSLGVKRTETRGWVSTAAAAYVAREREENLRYEQELKSRTGWRRLWLQILHKLG